MRLPHKMCVCVCFMPSLSTFVSPMFIIWMLSTIACIVFLFFFLSLFFFRFSLLCARMWDTDHKSGFASKWESERESGKKERTHYYKSDAEWCRKTRVSSSIYSGLVSLFFFNRYSSDVKLVGSFRFWGRWKIEGPKKSSRRQKVVTITKINEQHTAIGCKKFGKYVFIFDGFQVSKCEKVGERERESEK